MYKYRYKYKYMCVSVCVYFFLFLLPLQSDVPIFYALVKKAQQSSSYITNLSASWWTDV